MTVSCQYLHGLISSQKTTEPMYFFTIQGLVGHWCLFLLSNIYPFWTGIIQFNRPTSLMSQSLYLVSRNSYKSIENLKKGEKECLCPKIAPSPLKEKKYTFPFLLKFRDAKRMTKEIQNLIVYSNTINASYKRNHWRFLL